MLYKLTKNIVCKKIVSKSKLNFLVMMMADNKYY